MVWIRLRMRASWPVTAVQAYPAVMEAEKGHDWKRFKKKFLKKRSISMEWALGTGEPTLGRNKQSPFPDDLETSCHSRPGQSPMPIAMTESRKVSSAEMLDAF